MAKQQEFGELLVGFELIERHRRGESAHGPEHDRGPILTFRGRGIGKGCFHDLGQSNHRPFVDAVIIKHGIAEIHLAEKISSLVVAHSVPDDPLFLEKTGEGVGGGFLFDEPMVHEVDIDKSDEGEDED